MPPNAVSAAPLAYGSLLPSHIRVSRSLSFSPFAWGIIMGVMLPASLFFLCEIERPLMLIHTYLHGTHMIFGTAFLPTQFGAFPHPPSKVSYFLFWTVPSEIRPPSPPSGTRRLRNLHPFLPAALQSLLPFLSFFGLSSRCSRAHQITYHTHLIILKDCANLRYSTIRPHCRGPFFIVVQYLR